MTDVTRQDWLILVRAIVRLVATIVWRLIVFAWRVIWPPLFLLCGVRLMGAPVRIGFLSLLGTAMVIQATRQWATVPTVKGR